MAAKYLQEVLREVVHEVFRLAIDDRPLVTRRAPRRATKGCGAWLGATYYLQKMLADRRLSTRGAK